MFEHKLELNPFLVRAGLTPYAGVMERLCIPGVCFEPAGSGDGGARSGASRTGGTPALPSGMDWPRREPYPGVLASGRQVLGHRLTGWPTPEQGDPRLTAAASANGFLRLFDREPTPVERKQCHAETDDWTLLLQVSLVALWSQFGEGTLYFMMRKADLEKRDFDRVHAIYQQT